MDEVEQHRDDRIEPDEQLPGQAPVAGPGQQLLEAREQRGLSRESVAATLRLSASIVEQLELDRYDTLPPTIFVRGYLKSYAALLDLDPGPLLAAYNQAADVRDDTPLRVTGPVQTAPDMSQGMRRIMPIGLTFVVVIAAGVWGLDFYRGMAPIAGQATTAKTTVEAEPETVSEPEPEPETVIAEAAWESGTGPGLPVADETLPAVMEPDPETRFTDELAGPAENPDSPDSVPDLPESQALSAEATSVPVAGATEPFGLEEQHSAEASNGPLVLSFSGPSWVEVYDADGERLLYGLIESEVQQTLSGVAPYSLVIGDTNHVSVEHAGKEVDLGVRRPGRVARLQIPH